MDSKRRKIPVVAFWILQNTLPSNDYDSLTGDFGELYHYVYRESGPIRARLWIWGQILLSLPGFLSASFHWSRAMFGNYFKIALRNITRNKLNSFINITGLAIGVAACILIFSFIREELSYDTFHENRDNIYRFYRTVERAGRPATITGSQPFILGERLQEICPEIIHTTIFLKEDVSIKSGDLFIEEEVAYIDPPFFDMFTFPIISGDSENPLRDPSSMILTRSTAEKYFGDEDPVGKTLDVAFSEAQFTLTVTAVMDDVPSNSSFQFDFLINKLKALDTWGDGWFTSLTTNSPEVFALINEQASIRDLEEKFTPIEKAIVGDTPRDLIIDIRLEPFLDIHHNTETSTSHTEATPPQYMYILAGLGFLITFIACANFVILTVGNSTKRAKEIGVRKVLGAFRSQLRRQYLTESILSSLFSIIIGIAAAFMVLPIITDLTGMYLDIQIDLLFVFVVTAFGILIGAASGLYPAYLISRYRPATVLKTAVKLGKSSKFNRLLLVSQFAMTVFLIVSTIMMRDQLNYVINMDTGVKKDYTVVLSFATENDNSPKAVRLFKEVMMTKPDVLDVTAQSEPFGGRWTKLGYSLENDDRIMFTVNVVDPDYIEMMGLEILEGRNFSPEYSNDSKRSFIVNESFVKYVGWDDPLNSEFPENRYIDAKVIGVVKDFNYSSLRSEIEPLIIALDDSLLLDGANFGWGSFPLNFKNTMIRMEAGTAAGAVDIIRKTWKDLHPDIPYSISFLDEDIASQYNNDMNWQTIIGYASIIAVIIACLGLYGLSAAMSDKKLKEIGIRKVLGAGRAGILTLFAREISLLIVISNIIAWPVSYFVVDRWLNDFAYRTAFSAVPFLFAGIVVLAVALLTVSYHSMKAAGKNPVDIIRYE